MRARGSPLRRGVILHGFLLRVGEASRVIDGDVQVVLARIAQTALHRQIAVHSMPSRNEAIQRLAIYVRALASCLALVAPPCGRARCPL